MNPLPLHQMTEFRFASEWIDACHGRQWPGRAEYMRAEAARLVRQRERNATSQHNRSDGA